jgi:hypothetical protein
MSQKMRLFSDGARRTCGFDFTQSFTYIDADLRTNIGGSGLTQSERDEHQIRRYWPILCPDGVNLNASSMHSGRNGMESAQH